MALEKEVVLYNQILTTYHRIGAIRVDYLTKQGTAEVGSFASRIHREIAPDAPHQKERVDFVWNPTNNIVEDAYTAVKSHPTFQGAKDV